jgi:hypothetical protein
MVVERDHSPALAQSSERLVDDDLSEPSAKTVRANEIVELFVAPHIGFLDYVLGFGAVPEDSARQAVEALVVAAHNHLESRRIAGPYTGYQSCVGKSRRIGLRLAERRLRILMGHYPAPLMRKDWIRFPEVEPRGVLFRRPRGVIDSSLV